MENIKNNTQPSVEALEKLSLEGLSDDTIKLLNLYLQTLRIKKEIHELLVGIPNYKESEMHDEFTCFSSYLGYRVSDKISLDITGKC